MSSVVEAFKNHVQSVEKLMNFDRDVLEFAISEIDKLQDKLVQQPQFGNPNLTAERTLQILRGIREHDSLRLRYSTIFNQALVLLVSYFGSSVHDLFRQGVASALMCGSDSVLLQEQIKISLLKLRDADFQLKDLAPDLLVQAKDISFQDMQSIKRAFKDYLEITIDRSEDVNDIILAQGCRHVIVHSGGVVDDKLIRQLRDAKPRKLKLILNIGEPIQFSVEEVSQVAESMLAYLEAVASQVKAWETPF